VFLLANLLGGVAGAATAAPGDPPTKTTIEPASGPAEVWVRLETERGPLVIAVAVAAAPISAANFLRYVDAGLYDGARFHRTVRTAPDNQPQNAVKIDVIQAGLDPAREADAFPPIPLERTRDTGLTHRDGAVSMARAEPDTASGDFFVCLGDQPELDFGGRRNPDGQGFAVFGQLVGGMEVVRAIHQAPAEGQQLTPPVRIVSARRLTAAEAAALRAMDGPPEGSEEGPGSSP
jgi:peptidyl-prolyl cis-trans isomerase A (cyclophilin A)